MRTYGRDDNLPTEVEAIASDSAATYDYAYDGNKNPTDEDVGGSMANYSWTSDYDDEDRLIDFDWTSGYSQDWTLTDSGDWDATTVNSVAQDRSHSSGHKLTQLTSGGTTLTYDLKGNLTADANGQTYAWDFDNLLTSITTPTSTGHTFKYDVYGRRVWRAVTPSGGSTTTTGFVLASAAEGGQVMAEVAPMSAGTVVTRKFIWGEYVDDPLVQIVVSGSETKYYHHTNRMYSTIAITDGTGSVVERYAYTAYGEPTILNAAASSTLSASTIGNRTLYTGREWEPDAKVYYYRARYYEPRQGRFLGRDPIETNGGDSCLYAYVKANPSLSLDPTGMKLVGSGVSACRTFQKGSWLFEYTRILHSFIKIDGVGYGRYQKEDDIIPGAGSAEIRDNDASVNPEVDPKTLQNGQFYSVCREIFVDDCCIDVADFKSGALQEIQTQTRSPGTYVAVVRDCHSFVLEVIMSADIIGRKSLWCPHAWKAALEPFLW